MRFEGILLSAGAARTSKSLFTVRHDRSKQIPLHPMLGGALLIRVVESEKCVFVAVIALYAELPGEYRANGSAELHSS
jgi:hypothetical protein